MLDARFSPPAFRAEEPPPVARLLVGQPADVALEVVPRLFNLCRAAQLGALKAALGLPPDGDAGERTAEIRRDHLQRLLTIWPVRLGLADPPPPAAGTDAAGLARATYGSSSPPTTPAAFEAFLQGGQAAGATLAAIDALFGTSGAVPPTMPFVDDAGARRPVAAENTVAARHRRHPVMQHIAATRGRGPLWWAAARLYDLEATMQDELPGPRKLAPGTASVAAARGLYTVTVATDAAGRLTRFDRMTPTDHLVAPGGVLGRALASLPADRGALAPLLLAVLDPCRTITLTETADA